uniref:Uncharacterized protein n=1 Tax=Ceratitis capitata TaxID=7213 RepID=W8AW64_CERCA
MFDHSVGESNFTMSFTCNSIFQFINLIPNHRSTLCKTNIQNKVCMYVVINKKKNQNKHHTPLLTCQTNHTLPIPTRFANNLSRPTRNNTLTTETTTMTLPNSNKEIHIAHQQQCKHV